MASLLVSNYVPSSNSHTVRTNVQLQPFDLIFLFHFFRALSVTSAEAAGVTPGEQEETEVLKTEAPPEIFCLHRFFSAPVVSILFALWSNGGCAVWLFERERD